MPLSIFISMLWIMYVQLLPTRLVPSTKRATLPFSVFFHLQSVSSIFLLIAANMNFGAKLLIYIDLTKHFTHFLHQNAIFIRAILHQNAIFHYELLHQNTIFEIFAYLSFHHLNHLYLSINAKFWCKSRQISLIWQYLNLVKSGDELPIHGD